MRITLDIHRREHGRATGAVRAASQTDVMTFTGNLELLAFVERLYDVETTRRGHEAGAAVGVSSPSS
jgi:hypothetical protein